MFAFLVWNHLNIAIMHIITTEDEPTDIFSSYTFSTHSEWQLCAYIFHANKEFMSFASRFVGVQ